LNGFGREDLFILQDGSEEIITLLKEFGFVFAPFHSEQRIYLPKAWEATSDTPSYGTHGVHYFNSLDEVRSHVRSHELFVYRPTDDCIGGCGGDNGGEDGENRRRRSSTRRNSAQDLAQRKKMLSLRIWAATSKQPLPVFDWSQWGGKAATTSTVASTVQRRRGEEQKKPSGPQVAAAAAATAMATALQQEPEDRKPKAKMTTAKPAAAAAAAAQESSARGGESNSCGSTSETVANKKKNACIPVLAQQSVVAAATATAAQEPARVSLSPKRSSNEVTTTAMAKRPKLEEERESRADSPNGNSSDQDFTGSAVESNENISIEEIQAQNVALSSRIDLLKEQVRLKREELRLQRELKSVGAELAKLETLKEE